ncbi:hypothetical protein I4U23_017610 [Adineta vaga]|nr:hypothetical protein I4U23_017610 [Adineta vaga]
MRLYLLVLIITFILMFLFSMSDQVSLNPRTHGRGVVTSRNDQNTRGSFLTKHRGSIRRNHRHPIRPVDKNKPKAKPTNRFRPPHKRKD